MKNFKERMEGKTKTLKNGCVEWQGAKDKGGYGRFMSLNAHVAAYVIANGDIPPKGLEIDHLCRNRACVNASHLEVVTRKVNVLRGVSPSAQNRRKRSCLRGHPLSGDNLYIRKDGTGRTCKKCRADWARPYMRKKRRDNRLRNLSSLQ